jgi:hypothetical protein
MTDAPAPDRQPLGWRSQRRLLVLAVLADAVLAAALVAADSGVFLRPVTVFVFLVLGPGLAITGFLGLHEPATELAIVRPSAIRFAPMETSLP